MSKVEWALTCAVAGLVAAALWSQATKQRLAETPKTYIVATSSGATMKLKGTSISTSEFCTTIWRGSVADTIICVPHVITEDNDPTPEARTIY